MGTVIEQQLLDRSLACIYWPSSLKMGGCLLQRQQFPVTQKTATALKDPLKDPLNDHNLTSSCPPSPHFRNRDPSLVTLVPSRTTCLGGPFREMALICKEFMRDGSLSAPLNKGMATAGRLQAGGGLRARVRPGSHQSNLLTLGQELWPNQEVPMHCSNPMEAT